MPASKAKSSRKPPTFDLLDQVEETRRINNGLWMDILGLALTSAPEEAKILLKFINKNDKKISGLLEKLSK